MFGLFGSSTDSGMAPTTTFTRFTSKSINEDGSVTTRVDGQVVPPTEPSSTPQGAISDTELPSSSGATTADPPIDNPAQDNASAEEGLSVNSLSNDDSSSSPLKDLEGNGGSKFTVKAYPESADGAYGSGHYVVFYINEQTSARWATPSNNGPSRQTDDSSSSTTTTASPSVAQQNNPANFNISSLTNSLQNFSFDNTIDSASNVAKAIGDTVSNNIEGAVNKMLTRPTRRTNTAIALYMPGVSFSQDAKYNSESLTHAFGRIGTAGSVMAAWGRMIATPNGSTEQGNRAALAALSMSSLANGTQAQNAKDIILQNGFGVAENPLNVLLFSHVDFRQFHFEFILTPESPREAQNILDIIKLFKLNAAPEIIRGTAGRFWIPPNDFDVLFMHNGRVNTKLPKISTCVLEKIDVDYAASGIWQTHTDGMPEQIKMSLHFTETEIITKERVRQGY